ncbi:hypothetical protein Q9189_006585 [Teloschistes chrysophthalmus]
MEMPNLTPQQLQVATTYLSPQEALMTAALIPPGQLQQQLNHIHDDRAPDIVASISVVFALAVVAVTLRLICRRLMKVALSYDDYLILVGLFFTFAQCFCEAYTVRFGNGKHLIAVGVTKLQPNVKIQYALQFFWSFAFVFIKLSILLFYRRLFPTQNTSRTWRICHLLLCILSVILGIISTFGAAFQCTPVKYMWDLTIPGHCINFVAFARFTGVMNLVTDVGILSLPIPIVWSLKLERSKKIGVCALFLLGGFVCVTSIVRLYYLEAVGNGHSIDPTWDNVNTAIWTCVEPCIGVVCACLPIMAPLLRTHIVSFATSAFRSRKRSKQSGSSGYTGERGSRSRKGFGSLGEGKAGRERSGQDEEMGIPLRDKTEVGPGEGAYGS